MLDMMAINKLDMRYFFIVFGLLILLGILLSGCTVLRDPKTGKRLLFTTANSSSFRYAGAGVVLEVINMKHESATSIIGAGGSTLAAGGIGIAL